jgi:flagellar motility protein MotE (MotC chaperone)
MYAGFFVAMLLLAAYLTGVLQQGILPRLRPHEAAPQHGEQAATGDQQSASQESDKEPADAPMQEEQAPSPSSEERSSVPPTSHKPVVNSSNPSTQAPVAPGSSIPSSSGQRPAAGDQEKLLGEKRAELDRLEEQIRKRKEENEVEEKWLTELKASRATLTKERDARREAGIKKLAKLYEGMEPEAAASILGRLKKDMATSVLASMKDRQASKVLAAMNGQQAKELSERLEEARLDQAVGQGKAGEATP